MYNKTSDLLLGVLGLPFQELKNNNFQKAYIGIRDGDEYKYLGNLVLEFNLEGLDSFFLDSLYNHPSYCCSFDPDSQTTLLIFNFPETFKDEDREYFLEGTYSKVNKQFVNSVYDRSSYVSKIFYSSEELRKKKMKQLGYNNPYYLEITGHRVKKIPLFQEVYSKPSVDEEFYFI